MPELPEVETVRRQLDERLRGRTIASVELWRSGREKPVGKRFIGALTGRRVRSIDRRAKLLIWKFADGGALTAHLKMTGKFLFVDPSYVRTKHDRMRFATDRGEHVVWSDVRQFGFIHLVDDDELVAIIGKYGPEPLEAPVEDLASRLVVPKTRNIKAALLNQEVIAGVGNIYADEALHRAGILPTRRLSQLAADDRLRLAHEIKNVLSESLAQKGTSANDYVDTNGQRGGFLSLLRVYGRADEPCTTCGTPIVRITLGQRGTHYCPACQE